jgi:transposase
MHANMIFSQPDTFNVISVNQESEEVHIYVESKQTNCLCPNCGLVSLKVHSYYSRVFKDLPAFGNKVRLFLRARKFYCLEEHCQVKVFTERFADYFSPYKRRTVRFDKVCLKLVLESSGKAAERIALDLGIDISDTSLLRLISEAPEPNISTPHALGVDDWAYKKGHRYGTVLVNLENRKIIDILYDREATTLEKWLKSHAGVAVISRDRYGKYIQGATNGAPAAIQVADRWHLLKNLGEATTKVMLREYSRLNQVFRKEETQASEEAIVRDQHIPHSSDTEIRRQRFLELKELQAKGHSIKAMARHLKMHRQTIKKYIDMDTLPRKLYKDENMVESYFPYIKERLVKEPAVYIKTLWTELQEQGYKGAYSTFADALLYYGIRIGKKATHKKGPMHHGSFFKPSKAAVLFLMAENKLTEVDRCLIKKICTASNQLSATLSLIRSFRYMMINKQGTRLKKWIKLAQGAGIKEIASFATGLLTDYSSIENSISLQWSNGPLEGNVNKLKTIKRQMYGRASFELLKKRLLLAQVYPPKVGKNQVHRNLHCRLLSNTTENVAPLSILL